MSLRKVMRKPLRTLKRRKALVIEFNGMDFYVIESV